MPHSSGSGVPFDLFSATFSTPSPRIAHFRRTGVSGMPSSSEELFLRHRRDLGGGLALDEVGEHRGRRLADRAAAALEPDLLDDVALAEPDRDRDLVAAQRVLALRRRVGVLEQPVVPRALVVVEDELPVELVELAHYANAFFTLWRPSTSLSISSGIVYR